MYLPRRRKNAAPDEHEPAAGHLRRRFIVYSRRMIGAMLCWSVLQAVGTQWEDGRARAEAQRLAEARAAR